MAVENKGNQSDVLIPEWFIGLSTGRFRQSTIRNKLSYNHRLYIKVTYNPPFLYFDGNKMHSGTVGLKSKQSKQNITPSQKG